MRATGCGRPIAIRSWDNWPWTLLGGLVRPWRQHAAGGASGQHRSWGMLWTTQSKWLLRSDRPLSEDVRSSAARELKRRHTTEPSHHQSQMRSHTTGSHMFRSLSSGAPGCVARSDEVMGCAGACTPACTLALARARAHTHVHRHTQMHRQRRTRAHVHTHSHLLSTRVVDFHSRL